MRRWKPLPSPAFDLAGVAAAVLRRFQDADDKSAVRVGPGALLAGRAAPADRAARAGSRSQDPTSSRSRGKHCEAGSERARRPVSRAGRRRLRRRGRDRPEATRPGSGASASPLARVLQISQQAIYRTPTPRRLPQLRPPVDAVERAIVEKATANQTDGYRMI